MSMTRVLSTATESVPSEAPAVHPYLVGGISLAILLILLLALLSFGAGREHA
jgi:hypothetical protein